MIRILLVDDQTNVRRGLRMRLGIEDDMEVVGEASDGAQAVGMAHEIAADVVLMDVEMPVMDGVAAAGRFRAVAPETAVIMLSLHDDVVTRARAEAAGAVDFVCKHRMDETLLGAIRRAAGGRPSQRVVSS